MKSIPHGQVVVTVVLGTKFVSEADRCRKSILRRISFGEKYVQLLYTTDSIRKIMFSKRQVPKRSRSMDQPTSLGTVLLVKLPLYESCENEVREGPVVSGGPRMHEINLSEVHVAF